jgi:predicted phage terminase large subunit-like protein
VLHTAELDGRGVSARMEKEPGSSGKLVISHFRKSLEGYDFAGVPSTGAKYVRAKAFIAACERGEVSLVRSTWNAPFLDELERVTFTGSEHDDQADAAAGAYNVLTGGGLADDWDTVNQPMEARA